MVANFERRTKYHIGLVNKYCSLLSKYFQKSALRDSKLSSVASTLAERGLIHDQSKYGPEERLPYIWITEFYRCKNDGIKFEYPPGVLELTKASSYHHVTTNRHHPEFHESPSSMTTVDIAEMVADWAAMSEELGESSPRGWANKNVGTRWIFTDDQVQLIYRLIDEIEGRIG